MKQNQNFDMIPKTPAGISIYSVTQQAPHHHKGFLEIIYCLKGPVTIYTRLQDITLKEGDIISCDPFTTLVVTEKICWSPFTLI